MATQDMHELGVPCSQYIDNRHLGKLWRSEIASQTPRRYRCLTFSVPEEKKHKFIALCKVNFFSQRDNLDPLTTFPGQMHLPYFGGSSTAVYVVDHQCDLSLTEAGAS